MKIDPSRAKDLVGALQGVSQRIARSAGGRNVSLTVFLSPDPCTYKKVYTNTHTCVVSLYFCFVIIIVIVVIVIKSSKMR
jgi:hypothetical protein